MRHGSNLWTAPWGVAVAALLPLLAGCDQRGAGGTVETENTATARRLRVDSLLPFWNHPFSRTVATLRFDRSNFDFSTSTSNGRDLRFEAIDSAALPFAVDVWDSARGLGRVQLLLEGEIYRPWSLVRMRWGDRALVSASNPQAVWGEVSDSLALLVNSVQVDDFEGRSPVSRLPELNSWHYTASDSGRPWARIDSALAGRPGHALHVNYNAGYPVFAVAAITLASGPRILRSLDSVVFWARGNGQLYLALEHLTNQTGPKAWTHVGLTSSWTRYRIRPSDFDPGDGVGNNYGWNVVRDSVTDLTLFLSNGAEAWVDDIRFHGIDRDDLK